MGRLFWFDRQGVITQDVVNDFYFMLALFPLQIVGVESVMYEFYCFMFVLRGVFGNIGDETL